MWLVHEWASRHLKSAESNGTMVIDVPVTLRLRTHEHLTERRSYG